MSEPRRPPARLVECRRRDYLTVSSIHPAFGGHLKYSRLVMIGAFAAVATALAGHLYVDTAVERALRSATYATLLRQDGLGHASVTVWPASPPGMMLALHRSADSPAERPRTPLDFRIMLTAGSIRGTWLQYSSAEGVIGSGSKWFRVPDSFARWTRDLKAPAAQSQPPEGPSLTPQ